MKAGEMKQGAAGQNAEIATDRVIVLWAFAEVALGGLLHAFRIPFTGIMVGSASVLCLCLLGHYAARPREILRALVIVLAVKAAVTPHAPGGAYLAVGFQGMAAWLIFRVVPAKGPACILLGVLALVQSSVQKVVFMTILYGLSLWQAVDVLALAALGFFGLEGMDPASPSAWIIGAYLFLHLVTGFAVGFAGSRLPEWIRQGAQDPALEQVLEAGRKKRETPGGMRSPADRRRRQLKRGAGLVVAACLIGILVGLDRETGTGPGMQALFLLLRVAAVATVYLTVVAPLIRIAIRRLTRRKQETQAGRIAHILEELPRLRPMAAEAWKQAREGPRTGIRRGIRLFMAAVLRQPEPAGEPLMPVER